MNDLVVPAPTSDEKNLAMLAHLLGIVSGFIGALLIWLWKKDQSPYIRAQGREALNFQITMFIGYVVSSVLTLVLIGVLLFRVLLLVNVVLCVMAAISVSKGENFRYPFAIHLVS